MGIIYYLKNGFSTNQNYLDNLSKRNKGKNNPRYGKSLSDDLKLKFSFKGHKHSNETKLKISNANKGKTLSEETKNKISKVHKGKILSEETKNKISKAHKGKQKSDKFKEIRRKQQSNTVWINKDGKSSCIQKEQLDLYLKQGWEKGRGKLKKHSDNLNYVKAASTRIWLYKDGKITHCNNENRLIELIQQGWKLNKN